MSFRQHSVYLDGGEGFSKRTGNTILNEEEAESSVVRRACRRYWSILHDHRRQGKRHLMSYIKSKFGGYHGVLAVREAIL